MNKKFLFVVLLFMTIIKGFPQSSETGSSAYKRVKCEQKLSWEEVKVKAKGENKYIFVDVYATWCGPCKRMDNEVYPNDTVGNYMNGKFISVRVQIDSTVKDNEQVKGWYADAHEISKEYQIPACPTFLFFSPDCKLAYKDIGYKDVGNFIKLLNKASDPQNTLYYARLEDYKTGKKNYEKMQDLALFKNNVLGDDVLGGEIAQDYINHSDRKQLRTKENILFVLNVARNRKLADSLAQTYKTSYLDRLSEENLCTKENIMFIDQFQFLINSKDNFFQLCYLKPGKVDSAINFKGSGDYYVQETISKEEIGNKVLKNGKAVAKYPDWKKMQDAITKKYKAVDAKLLVLRDKINYYHNSWLDWRLWAKYKDEMIRTYPPTSPYGLQIYGDINMYGAWDAFLHCPDQTVLLKALEWIDIALKLEGSQSDYLGTKANLLYKLGRKDQALSFEKEALALTPDDKEKNDYYKKMQLGDPTWPQPQAVLQNK